MSLFVDTSVWSLALRRDSPPEGSEVRRLREALGGGEHTRFKPRPLAGTDAHLRDIAPETLVLDGQQRLTSLYQALMSQSAVQTKDSKGKPIRRRSLGPHQSPPECPRSPGWS